MMFLTYGERLAQIRTDHHLTKKAMAQAVGVTAATWSNYERDISFPHQKTILNIKSVFHVNDGWLEESEPPIYEDGYIPGESPLGEKVDYDEYLQGIAHDYEYQHWLGVLGPEHEDLAYTLAYGKLPAEELLKLLGGDINEH